VRTYTNNHTHTQICRYTASEILAISQLAGFAPWRRHRSSDNRDDLYTITHTHTLKHIHTHTHTLSLSLSLSLFHNYIAHAILEHSLDLLYGHRSSDYRDDLCTHTYTHTYIHTHTHARTHIHIYTCRYTAGKILGHLLKFAVWSKHRSGDYCNDESPETVISCILAYCKDGLSLSLSQFLSLSFYLSLSLNLRVFIKE